MIDNSALLASVVCGRCKTSLINHCEEKGLVLYKCACTLKVRTFLICLFCKKSFLTFPYLIRKSNYCSKSCYWVGTNKKELRICKICSKEFFAKAPLIKKGFGFYCSMDCWFSLFKEQRIEVKCKQCKKIFNVTRAVFKKHPQYCSKTCKDDFERDYIERTCRGCKQKFQLPRWEFKKGKGTFCTRECFKHYDGETSIERLVRLELRRLKEPFKQETKIGRFYADFYLPNRNLIIECDGEYWHRSEKAQQKDLRKDELLLKMGYKILRLQEEMIKKDVNLALQILRMV